jgi:crotonobetainyl-CoA:carnitine CoA-transferase CaiB-like acyl-CoA transferase
LNAAFASRSAFDMEVQLNAVGVPSARVRKLGEFLRETDNAKMLTLPDFRFSQGAQVVRTAGLGFSYAQDGGPSTQGAESLGQSTRALLEEVGIATPDMEALERTGVVKYA